MKYLDEWMYSHFVLRVTHCFAIESILFLVIAKCMCVRECVCVFPTFSLTFIPQGW